MDLLPRLPKETTAKVYCLCYIAERSVDFARINESAWHDFLVFFTSERKKLFEDACGEIPTVLASETPQLRALGPFNALLLSLWASVRPCPSAFVFVPSEIGFIRSSLRCFQELLQLPNLDVVRLSCARRDLGKCQSIIERKWLNRKRWAVLRKADHFCKNPALGTALDLNSAVREFMG